MSSTGASSCGATIWMNDPHMHLSGCAKSSVAYCGDIGRVLAACGTLRGRESGVEGMPSVARSFLEAGASTVVGTLADVNDEITARLLHAFHRHLAAGDSAAEGLRKAQLDAIARGGDDAREENWAPFVVYTTVL